MEFQRSAISQQDKEAIEKRDAIEKAREEQELIAGARKKLNLPPRFQDATFDNFYTERQPTACTAALDFIDQQRDMQSFFKGLYLYGIAGSGKTHIAAAIANKLMMEFRPRFVTVPELLIRIKKNFNTNADDEFLDNLSRTRLLVLDDIGSEKPTEWVQETLFVLIDRRYTHYLPTIFTSNCSLDQLAERLGYRIASRIAEMSKVVELKKVDYRIIEKTK